METIEELQSRMDSEPASKQQVLDATVHLHSQIMCLLQVLVENGICSIEEWEQKVSAMEAINDQSVAKAKDMLCNGGL